MITLWIALAGQVVQRNREGSATFCAYSFKAGWPKPFQSRHERPGPFFLSESNSVFQSFHWHSRWVFCFPSESHILYLFALTIKEQITKMKLWSYILFSISPLFNSFLFVYFYFPSILFRKRKFNVQRQVVSFLISFLFLF